MDSIIIDIDNIAFGGAGTGRHEGKVFFVPGTLPGEKVKVRILKEKPNYTRARLVEVLEASPDRIEPVCPFGIRPEGLKPERPTLCPGCSYQHAAYEKELEIKQEQFRELLERTAEIPADALLPPVGSPEILNYRNKIKLHVFSESNETNLGYVMENNHSVLDIPECPLAKKEINEKLTELREKTGFIHSLHNGMELTLRSTANDGVLYWRNNPDKRASWLKEETSLGTVSVPLGGFFQINSGICDMLIEKIGSFVKELKPELMIDLYCGAGIFSLDAAKAGAQKVVGVDCDEKTIDAARYNASRHDCANCEFHAGDAGRIFSGLTQGIDPEKTLLVVDPPRNGLSRKARAAIAKSAIKDIIYISCGPDTLSRDLRDLSRAGYETVSFQLFDMFPRTPHFETLTCLRKN